MDGVVSAEALLSTRPLGGTAAAPAPGADQAAARAAARQFESVFLAQMLAPMFEGLGQGPFGGGQAEGVWRSLLINQYGELMSQAGGVGIADQVMDQILKTQEG